MIKKLAISAPTPISPMKKKKKKSTMTPGSLAARANIWAKPPVVTLAIVSTAWIPMRMAAASRRPKGSMFFILFIAKPHTVRVAVDSPDRAMRWTEVL